MARNESWDKDVSGSGNGTTILELKSGSIRDIKRFVLMAMTGQVRVFAGLVKDDGAIEYAAKPLVLALEPNVDGSDNVTEPQGTFVAATDGTRLHYFFGTYFALKFVQKGATAARILVYANEQT